MASAHDPLRTLHKPVIDPISDDRGVRGVDQTHVSPLPLCACSDEMRIPTNNAGPQSFKLGAIFLARRCSHEDRRPRMMAAEICWNVEGVRARPHPRQTGPHSFRGRNLVIKEITFRHPATRLVLSIATPSMRGDVRVPVSNHANVACQKVVLIPTVTEIVAGDAATHLKTDPHRAQT